MQKTIKKMAVANRGEIAVRIISTCREMGITPVLLYSSADKNSLACRMSEEKVCIEGPPEESYLNVSAVVQGALSAGAGALHPGYGFLSENPKLSKACKKNNIVFIGPPEHCLKIFGDKRQARATAQKCGLPVLPAYTGSLGSKEGGDAGSGGQDMAEDFSESEKWLKKARKIGFPVMIKSAKGGGGRGLKLVSSEKDWPEALASAKRECLLAFGSSEIFIEKYLPFARHIEVQVFADSTGRVFHLFDRDCSVQRKHQKIIEEAPALLPPFIQQEMREKALALLKSVGYRQAGTVEFLYQAGEFYFMEVNPRIQVECPVTEMILGVDLIKAQILNAQGQDPFIQKEFSPRGHSIQCRIYAEDMQKQMPVFGPLGALLLPQAFGRRFDMGYEGGDEVPGFYDSMLGKLIVWEESRPRAIEKMKNALKETVVFGLKTNLSFLQDLVSHKSFIKAEIYTRFVEDLFLKSWQEKDIKSVDKDALLALRRAFSACRAGEKTPHSKTRFNPWTYFS